MKGGWKRGRKGGREEEREGERERERESGGRDLEGVSDSSSSDCLAR